MIEFEDVFGILQQEVYDSQAISAPFPVMISERLYDVFFTYFVDERNKKVEPPEECLAVLYEERRVVNVGDAFGFRSLEAKHLELERIDAFRDKLVESRKIYGDVRLAIALGETSIVVSQYCKLIGSISQPCLLSYYEALGMVFD